MKKFIFQDLGVDQALRYRLVSMESYNMPVATFFQSDLVVISPQELSRQLLADSLCLTALQSDGHRYAATIPMVVVSPRSFSDLNRYPITTDELGSSYVVRCEIGNGAEATLSSQYLHLVEVLPAPVLDPNRPFQVGDRVRIRTTSEFYQQRELMGVATIVDLSVINSLGLNIKIMSEDRFRSDVYKTRDLEHFISAKSDIKIMEKFTIGSDIEFTFIKDGEQVNASVAMIESFRETGEVGTDHGGEVGEFRPKFGNDILEHTDNLKKAIRLIVEGGYMREDTFLDSSHILGSRVVGGHIHFGIKDKVLIEKCKRNLDYWLLPTVQPLFPKEVFLERIKNYGRLGGESVRMQPHGFEYRLVPSFIFNEGITLGIFALAYSIVKLTIEGKLKVRINEMDSTWQAKFIDNYNKYGLTELNDVREEAIKKLLNKNLLGGLDKYINPLFDAIKYQAEFSGDIAEGWGMEYEYVLNRRSEEVVAPSRIRRLIPGARRLGSSAATSRFIDQMERQMSSRTRL